MEERIFNQKDIQGLGRVLSYMASLASGASPSDERCEELCRAALAAGLTVDEMFNPINFVSVNFSQNMEEFLDRLICNNIKIVALKDNENWADGPNMVIITDIVKAFFKGEIPGPYAVISVNELLKEAISKNDLQTLLSYETYERLTKDTQVVNIEGYLKLFIAADLPNLYSKEQIERRELEAYSVLEMCENAEECNDECNGESKEACQDIEAEDGEAHNISTESIEEGNICPTEKDDLEFSEHIEVGTVVNLFNPRDMKRNHIVNAIYGLQVDELITLLSAFDSNKCYEEVLDDLTDGKIEGLKEQVATRNVHQIINSMLYPYYISCTRMQGVEVSEELASKTDFLAVSWDLRDKKTRRLQKMRELIMEAMQEREDDDLLGALNDLESIYSNN